MRPTHLLKQPGSLRHSSKSRNILSPTENTPTNNSTPKSEKSLSLHQQFSAKQQIGIFLFSQTLFRPEQLETEKLYVDREEAGNSADSNEIHTQKSSHVLRNARTGAQQLKSTQKTDREATKPPTRIALK